jgi:ABC-type uncharacterized transport system substrate-binding protein
MPAKDVKAYVKRNKHDAADAEAICEAVRRPTMRFVQVKSADQQGRLMQHRTRDLLLRQRTQVINALRAHMAELGIVAAQGSEGLKQLLAVIADDKDGRLPIDARASLPDGNVTGFTAFELAMLGKSLEILKQIAPAVVRVALIYNPDNPNSVHHRRISEAASAPRAIETVDQPIHGLADIVTHGLGEDFHSSRTAIKPCIPKGRPTR